MKTTVQKELQAATTTEQQAEFVSPEVNIYETAEGYLLEAEMPGVGKEGLEITLEGDEITLVGHRHTEPLKGTGLFSESRAADYRRVFELDPAIDTAKISAAMDQGVLTLKLPKSDQVKPRKIKVD